MITRICHLQMRTLSSVIAQKALAGLVALLLLVACVAFVVHALDSEHDPCQGLNQGKTICHRFGTSSLLPAILPTQLPVLLIVQPVGWLPHFPQFLPPSGDQWGYPPPRSPPTSSMPTV
ncbi:MAG: hypothetical protein HY347_07090 [candidate division NC10 bacterium]|nr:hypothetical protein [candidate division NC10 bacterium]